MKFLNVQTIPQLIGQCLPLYISQIGLRSLICVTPSSTALIAKSISSSVVNLPKLKRNEECAKSSPKPNATRTYDGSNDADVHADPEETAISLIESHHQPSPSTCLNEILVT